MKILGVDYTRSPETFEDIIRVRGIWGVKEIEEARGLSTALREQCNVVRDRLLAHGYLRHLPQAVRIGGAMAMAVEIVVNGAPEPDLRPVFPEFQPDEQQANRAIMTSASGESPWTPAYRPDPRVTPEQYRQQQGTQEQFIDVEREYQRLMLDNQRRLDSRARGYAGPPMPRSKNKRAGQDDVVPGERVIDIDLDEK